MYLIRHGATDHNLQRPPILQGRTVDLALSGEGVRQAEAVASFLSQAQLDAVFCSTLKRARQTAEFIAGPHQLRVMAFPQLAEVDVGSWENRSWMEIEQTEPEAYRLFHEDPGTHGYAGGENLSQVLARVRDTFEELAATHVGCSIAVVGHNVVNRSYLAHVLGVPMAKARKVMQDNCCVNVIRYTRGESVVFTLNSTFHLYR